MVDLNKPVVFYDDRSKDLSSCKMTNILYQDKLHCLCEAEYESENVDTRHLTVFFSLEDGEVLGASPVSLQFWYAKNEPFVA